MEAPAFMLGSLDFYGQGDTRIAVFDWTGLANLNSPNCNTLRRYPDSAASYSPACSLTTARDSWLRKRAGRYRWATNAEPPA